MINSQLRKLCLYLKFKLLIFLEYYYYEETTK